MRTILVTGLATVAFMSGLGPSEARFRLRLSPHVGAARPTLVHAAPVPSNPVLAATTQSGTPRAVRMIAGAALAAPLSVRTAEALAPGEVGEIGLPQAPAPVPAPAPRKESAPWCPTGQVTGSGAGFCIIN